MLEQRLTDTEAALFDVMEQLQTIRAKMGMTETAHNTRISQIDIFRSSKSTKTTRMAEWEKLSLETAQDIEMWWHYISRDLGVGSSKLTAMCVASLLNGSGSSQRLPLENIPNGGEMQSSPDQYDQTLQNHPNELQSFGEILDPAYINAHLLQGGRAVLPEDGHPFSQGVEGSIRKEYPPLDAVEETNDGHGDHQRLKEYNSMSDTTSGAFGVHEHASPMSMASSLGQRADATKLHETSTTRTKAHSLSKELDHIYY